MSVANDYPASEHVHPDCKSWVKQHAGTEHNEDDENGP